jgi:hypothetical protein
MNDNESYFIFNEIVDMALSTSEGTMDEDLIGN